MSDILKCDKCDLSKHRSQVIVGEGNKSSKIWIVGINPTAEDDKQGKPFTDSSGKILRKALKDAEIENIYFTHLCRCSSPKNRKPTSKEMIICRNNLSDDIIEHKPHVIVTLGAFVYESLTGNKIKITKEHGCDVLGRMKYDFNEEREPQRQIDYYILPVFNPKYILRKESDEKLINELVLDLKYAKELNDIAVEAFEEYEKKE